MKRPPKKLLVMEWQTHRRAPWAPVGVKSSNIQFSLNQNVNDGLLCPRLFINPSFDEMKEKTEQCRSAICLFYKFAIRGPRNKKIITKMTKRMILENFFGSDISSRSHYVHLSIWLKFDYGSQSLPFLIWILFAFFSLNARFLQ